MRQSVLQMALIARTDRQKTEHIAAKRLSHPQGILLKRAGDLYKVLCATGGLSPASCVPHHSRTIVIVQLRNYPRDFEAFCGMLPLSLS